MAGQVVKKCIAQLGATPSPLWTLRVFMHTASKAHSSEGILEPGPHSPQKKGHPRKISWLVLDSKSEHFGSNKV